ncbi:hypothetical protein J2Z32_001325 [Paenibacillus turicensis]|uniref:Uncharacterized protein n=1 Tax=Paenibacillus turicensis TaxID=160487 RepID=A0ABS4FQ41_9BACL|nr:hypothetical protein [Paenibacillus turicensis]MBP1904702.1 hypothetical protein [Paenibacillus turicensis]
MSKRGKKILIILLTLGFITSLGTNVFLYKSNSHNRSSTDYLKKQYNTMLSQYEQSIISISQDIISMIETGIDQKKLSSHDILLLYKLYADLDKDQRTYASYVQDYNSPDGKKVFPLDTNEPIILNYAPGLIYFNSSIAMFGQLSMQNSSHSEVVITNELEKRLKLTIEILKLNKAVYEKYITQDFDAWSDEAVLPRLKLQQELLQLSTKLTELDVELSKLNN